MKITVTKLPKTMPDEQGNEYNVKKLMPTGRMTDWHRNFKGWQYILGNRMITINLHK